MQVYVHYFGEFRQDQADGEVSFDGALSCKAAFDLLFPDKAMDKVRFAVNDTLCSSDALLKEGDRLAIMPPFSGG